MKQFGNLAMTCARRSDLVLTLQNGWATVQIGCGPDKVHETVHWTMDDEVSALSYELNHGKYRQNEMPAQTAPSSVYVCYEIDCPGNPRGDDGMVELTVCYTKKSRDAWIKSRLETGIADGFVMDEDTDLSEELKEITENDCYYEISLHTGDQDNDEHFKIISKKADMQI